MRAAVGLLDANCDVDVVYARIHSRLCMTMAWGFSTASYRVSETFSAKLNKSAVDFETSCFYFFYFIISIIFFFYYFFYLYFFLISLLNSFYTSTCFWHLANAVDAHIRRFCALSKKDFGEFSVLVFKDCLEYVTRRVFVWYRNFAVFWQGEELACFNIKSAHVYGFHLFYTYYELRVQISMKKTRKPNQW